MILLTRLNGSQFYVNAEMIQFVENTPDTVVTLVDKSKLVVQEPAEEVVQRFIAYRRQTNHMDLPKTGEETKFTGEK